MDDIHSNINNLLFKHKTTMFSTPQHEPSSLENENNSNSLKTPSQKESTSEHNEEKSVSEKKSVAPILKKESFRTNIKNKITVIRNNLSGRLFGPKKEVDQKNNLDTVAKQLSKHKIVMNYEIPDESKTKSIHKHSHHNKKQKSQKPLKEFIPTSISKQIQSLKVK